MTVRQMLKGGFIGDLFSRSPFGAMVAHSKKVHECLQMVKPLMEALVHENYIAIQDLQDQTSKLEYQADKIKHEIREQLTHRYFLPVDRADLEGFINCQERMADYAKDFAVILIIRKTRLHPGLVAGFAELVEQVLKVGENLLAAALEMQDLADSSFGGAESKKVLKLIEGLGEEEWKADRIARRLSKEIYKLEHELDTVTILFYEKLLLTLSAIANEAENAGDSLRVILYRA
ncbi:MAG: DUF47 family protein [Proteobacteria bacterium]|nr:DUF47 family protein [Pseudomonadota bacterium]MBU1737448.1 DUF47 family protein [Pseudomonadota bacterium]